MPKKLHDLANKLKGKPGIDSPWAVATAALKRKKKAETVSAGLMSALLRSAPAKQESRTWKETGQVLREAVGAELPAGKLDPSECAIFRVVLITEGLGNRNNMNYYGPEAIDSAPRAFEGKSCFIDHPSKSEDTDRPERSAWHKAGYFKGCQVEAVGDRRGVTAELHFDASEAGHFAAAKARTALHYQAEFPGSDEQYVGLSVNAGGDTVSMDKLIDGEMEKVNYVTNFTEAASCDLVTCPARGGKFLALVESAAGAIIKTREGKAMIIKTLQAALAALKESGSEKDAEKAKKARESAEKQLKALLAEAEKADKADKDAAESEGDGEGEAEGYENEAEAKKMKAAGMYEKGAAMMAQAVAMGHAPIKVGDGPDPKPAPGAKDPADQHAEPDGDEAKESKRLAIEGLLKEAKVNKDHVNFVALCGMKLAEARAEIDRTRKIRESIAKDIMAKLDLPAGHPAREAGAPAVASNQAIFNGLTK